MDMNKLSTIQVGIIYNIAKFIIANKINCTIIKLFMFIYDEDRFQTNFRSLFTLVNYIKITIRLLIKPIELTFLYTSTE